jgi:nucleoside-diphosphate-sugar epimerase
MKKVLLTGATGFIGRHCISTLLEKGFEVHATYSKSSPIDRSDIVWHQVDLFDSERVDKLLSQLQPSYLLHLAWYVVPGKLATAIDNFYWVQSSLELVRKFVENGGQRLVISGSGYEYDWNYGYCSELVTPLVPNTLYGTCKNALWSLVEAYANKMGASSAWGRVFFLYGPYEHPNRLVPAVIRPLLQGESARCSHGNQIREYLHVQDVADGLVALLDSKVSGAVNIASGQPIALKDIINSIAQKLHREELILLGAIPSNPNDTPLVVANIDRAVNELGWQPKYSLDRGLDQTIEWWKSHQTIESATNK